MSISRSTTFILAGLVTIVSAGCSSIERVFFDPDPTVRQAAQAACSPQTGQLENFRSLGSREWDGGKSVIYQATCRSSSPQQPSLNVVGYVMFVRQGWEWFPGGSSSTGRPLNSTTSPEKMIDFVVSQGTNQGKPFVAVHGQILNAQVEAIEAQFSNGKTMRDSGEDNIFALVVRDSTQICQIRVLGAAGKILQKHQVGSEAKPSACSA